MRKIIILMAAFAVAAAVQTSPRAFAQTAPASKDAGSTTTLTAQQQKKNVAPVVRTAPAHTVVRSSPPMRSISRPTSTVRSISRPTSTVRSVSRPTSTTRSVVKSTKSITGVSKKTLTHIPGGKKTLTHIPGGKKTLTLGPGGKKILTKGPGGKFAKTDGRRRIGINRDRRRIFVNNRWRTLIPLIALGTFMYDDETYYADGYVSMAEPGCTGYAEDGSRLRWMAVPTEDGGSEYQCVAYSTQRNRTVTEIEVPEEPMAEAPTVAEPETTGVGPAKEPAVASPVPAAPATGCELLIYSETNFKGLSAPVDENQSSLSKDGWQNEIASVQIKSGTWDFYSDEDYAGEMMRLSAGSYPTLDPKWSKHIGSFMCSAPAK